MIEPLVRLQSKYEFSFYSKLLVFYLGGTALLFCLLTMISIAVCIHGVKKKTANPMIFSPN